jgi:predicted Na+-dependent transporter
MSDGYLRILLAQIAAFVGALLIPSNVGALLAPAGMAGSPVVVTIFQGFVLLPFVLVDALAIRPWLSGRVNPVALFGLEFIALVIYRGLIQWRGLVSGSNDDRLLLARHVVVEISVFLLLYFVLGYLFNRLFQGSRAPANW